jgi:hypothetical protein
MISLMRGSRADSASATVLRPNVLDVPAVGNLLVVRRAGVPRPLGFVRRRARRDGNSSQQQTTVRRTDLPFCWGSAEIVPQNKATRLFDTPGGSEMFERYTESARRVLFFARYEASQIGTTEITTEHLLFGLIREGKGT